MKQYIFLVKQICKEDHSSCVAGAFRSIEDAENFRHVFYDVDGKFIGYIEMIELK